MILLAAKDSSSRDSGGGRRPEEDALLWTFLEVCPRSRSRDLLSLPGDRKVDLRLMLRKVLLYGMQHLVMEQSALFNLIQSLNDLCVLYNVKGL